MNTEDTLPPPDAGAPTLSGYRKRALAHYQQALQPGTGLVCVVCGFGIQAVLEIAHLNQDRKDNSLDNLAVLCPTCHKMHDIGLIPKEVVLALRNQKAEVNWKLRIKDAGAKAAATRKLTAVKKRKSDAGKKAWATKLAKPAPSDA